MDEFADAFPVIIAGKEYRLRRLTVRDVFKLGDKLLAGYRRLAEKPAFLGALGTEEGAARLGLEALAEVLTYEELAEFYADLLGMSLEEFFALPERAFDDIQKALEDHLDLKAFFGRVDKYVMEKLSVLATPSTSSKRGMAGRTTKS